MREVGQVMQETEHSMPPERLAGGLTFSAFQRSASQRAALRARPFLPSASTYARV